jgi:hypothetical protein
MTKNIAFLRNAGLKIHFVGLKMLFFGLKKSFWMTKKILCVTEIKNNKTNFFFNMNYACRKTLIKYNSQPFKNSIAKFLLFLYTQ